MTAPPHETSALLAALPGVRHAFFGRAGGVSEGDFAGLNTGPGSGDDPEAVAENRARAAAVFGAPPERLLSPRQVHSARARIVETPWEVSGDGERPEVDALATATPNLAISVLAADCAPVLLADPDAKVVAAAHAGWRGALGGVTDAALAAMEELGAERANIRAAIGPCIGQEAYEVGPEFKARFLAESPRNAALFVDGAGDRSHFDLPGYVARRLGLAGIGRVETFLTCTATRGDLWFSRRAAARDGKSAYGRNLSAIMLADPD